MTTIVQILSLDKAIGAVSSDPKDNERTPKIKR